MATPIDPSNRPKLVVPNDTQVLTYHGEALACRGISFAVAGDLAVRDDKETIVIIPNGALVAGVIHPIGTDLIKSTGTTATGIVAYF